MQPYQKASDRTKEQIETGPNTLRTAATTGLGFAGGAMASKILPFLSKYIPRDLAIKGLAKVDQRLGAFINTALHQGEDFDDVKDFIEQKVTGGNPKGPAEEKKKKPNQLGQIAPELQAYIEQEIQGGKSPEHAASTAYAKPEMKPFVEDVEEYVGIPFHQYIRQLYEGKAVQSQSQPDQMMGQPSAPQQMQQAPQQGGQGQQALMSILQKIQQSRGQQP